MNQGYQSSFETWLEQLSQLPGLFMTGTDTGVGKTWVGTRLLQHLRRLGVHITPRKPVESGWLAEQIQKPIAGNSQRMLVAYSHSIRFAPTPC